MQTYAQFAPTSFDHAGAFLPHRRDWLVAPVSHNRDSDLATESNWAAALALLGGESKGVEVHRFNHWGPGWFEIILINPRSRYVSIAEDIEERLEDYPLLDDEDVSKRESEAYDEAWESYGRSDFLQSVWNELQLGNYWRLDEWFTSLDSETVRTFFESLLPSGDYFDRDDGSPRTSDAASNCTVADLLAFVRAERRKRDGIGATLTRFYRLRDRSDNLTFAFYAERYAS